MPSIGDHGRGDLFLLHRANSLITDELPYDIDWNLN